MKHSFLIISLSAISLNLLAQKTHPDSLQTTDKTNRYYSVTNLRPVNINKGNFLFSSQNEFVKYYKVYNPQTGKIEKISDKIVLNEASFNFYTVYGVSQKINLIGIIPVLDFHHYSPMVFSKGIGFGDIQIGLNYNVLNKTNNALSIRFDAGFPTGKSQNLTQTDIPLGTGAFSAQLSAAGIHSFKKIDFVYSAYYKYFTADFSGGNSSDETGIYAFLQKEFKTEFGDFGIESGIKSFIRIPSGNFTQNLSAEVFIGVRYAYNDKLNLSFEIPYTVLQQNAFITKYYTILQFDYLLNKNQKL